MKALRRDLEVTRSNWVPGSLCVCVLPGLMASVSYLLFLESVHSISEHVSECFKATNMSLSVLYCQS